MEKNKDLISKKEVDKLSYEEAFTELEKIVQALESEQASLEDTLALFERGQKLVKHCSALLEAADLRLQVLSEKPGFEVQEKEGD
jgi:exodeoxyribonuclease VII small subunit